MDKKIIAMLAYEVDRSYGQSLKEPQRPQWVDLTDEERDTFIKTVDVRLSSRRPSPENQHREYLEQLVGAGWTYGEVYDAESKKNPMLRDFSQLSQPEQARMYIFNSIVDTLAKFRTDDALSLLTGVKYVGIREQWVDHLYGTNLTFTKDQVQYMPDDLAKRFLSHTDMFSSVAQKSHDGFIPDREKAPEFLAKKELEEELSVLDTLPTMTKGAMQKFAWQSYNVKLPDRMGVDDMRMKVTELVNNYGL